MQCQRVQFYSAKLDDVDKSLWLIFWPTLTFLFPT